MIIAPPNGSGTAKHKGRHSTLCLHRDKQILQRKFDISEIRSTRLPSSFSPFTLFNHIYFIQSVFFSLRLMHLFLFMLALIHPAFHSASVPGMTIEASASTFSCFQGPLLNSFSLRDTS